MLTFEQITCKINNKVLFKELNITFLPSAIIYLTGPNGIGKTTLLRVIAGVKNPASGQILFKGKNITDWPRPYANYINHNLAVKPELTVLENLRSWAEIHNTLELLEAAIHYFALQSVLDTKCFELSAGALKKVALARLLSCQSGLWLLDEVEAHLDAPTKILLNNLIISRANSGGIIILATHTYEPIKSGQIFNLEEYQCYD